METFDEKRTEFESTLYHMRIYNADEYEIDEFIEDYMIRYSRFFDSNNEWYSYAQFRVTITNQIYNFDPCILNGVELSLGAPNAHLIDCIGFKHDILEVSITNVPKLYLILN